MSENETTEATMAANETQAECLVQGRKKERDAADEVAKNLRKNIIECLVKTNWMTVYLNPDAPDLVSAERAAFAARYPEIRTADLDLIVPRVRGHITRDTIQMALRDTVGAADDLTSWESTDDRAYAFDHLASISAAADQVETLLARIVAAAPWADRVQCLNQDQWIVFDVRGRVGGMATEVALHYKLVGGAS